MGAINQFRHFVSPKRDTTVTLQRAVTVSCTAGTLLVAENVEVGRSSSYLLTVQNKMVHSDTTCFDIKKLYFSQPVFYVFCVDLRTNSHYFPIQHLLTGFYNRHAVCLLRGTD